MLSPVANYDSPSCRDGTGPWVFLMESLCIIIAGTGSGPEGSRPTAGNCRLQVYGEENASGLTGMQARWQPSACLPFYPKYISSILKISPNTTGNDINRLMKSMAKIEISWDRSQLKFDTNPILAGQH